MLDKFIKDHIGMKNDNGYGAYSGECVSLVQRFNKALGNPRQWGNGEAYRTNLVNNKLGVHVPLNKARAGDIIAGLNNSHVYGHVALVINSTQVLEQAGPTAGGDGIAKVGTIANFVKRYPNYKVTRLHAYKYVEPIKPIVPSEFIEEKGYQIVTNRLIEKRDNPSVKNPGKLVAVPKGSILEVVGYQHAEGYLWRKLVNGQWISTGPSNGAYDWAKLEPLAKNKEVAENGVLKADLGTNINIRKEPSKKSNIVGRLTIGNEIAYSAYIDNDNIRWAKTAKGYIAIREVQGVKFGTARLVKENKPANDIVIGSKVKIKQGSFYQGSAKGKPVSAYAYSKAWKVLEIKDNIAKLDNINSWLAIKDLVKVN